MRVFKIDGQKVKRTDAFVDASLHLTNKVDLGRVGGDRRFGFICLRCRRLRTGKRIRFGFIKCDTCGFVAEW